MKYFRLPLKIKCLLGLFLIGFVVGIVTLSKTESTIPILGFTELSKIRIFINTFSINIWSLFIIWCLGYNAIGIVLILVITFLKGYIEGGSLACIFKMGKTLSSINIISFIIYWLIMIPLFLWLVNKVTKVNDIMTKREDDRLKIIIIVMIVDVLYSLIIALIN